MLCPRPAPAGGRRRREPADIDLYLQRQRADGKTWGRDMATGGSASLTEASLATARLLPGTYRIEVHNWAGAPVNAVAVTARFFDRAGVAG